MQVATLDYDDFLGYLAIGRMRAGKSKVGDRVLLAHRDGKREEFRVQKVLGFQGLKRFELAEAIAGDIVAFTGMAELNVGETITSIQNPTILPLLKVDAPTITMNFRVNDGPFAGREGKWVTSRNLKERLEREIKSNVALRVEETDSAGVFKVSGRGELHLTVLIETMRREGYELCVSQPQVILGTDEHGKTTEPLRGRGDRSRRELRRAGRRRAQPPARRDERDAAVGARPDAARVPDPGTRADRLSLAVHDRHARHGRPLHAIRRRTARRAPTSARARTAC